MFWAIRNDFWELQLAWMTSCTCTGTPPWVQNTLSSLFTWVTSELKVMWTCCRFCEIVLNDLDYSALHHLSLLGCKSTLSLFFVDVWKFHRRLWTQVTLTKFTVNVYGSTWRSFSLAHTCMYKWLYRRKFFVGFHAYNTTAQIFPVVNLNTFFL